MKWLSATEQRAWIGLLASVSGLEHASDQQLQADAGISLDTYAILAALSESEKATLHMSELAGIAGHSQSRLSHTVSRLERAGFVSRNECPADKRAVHATLTPAGLRLVREAAPGHVTAIRELVFDRLTAEQTQSLADITAVLVDVLVEAGHVPRIAELKIRVSGDKSQS